MGEHSLQHTTDHVRNLQFGFCVSGCSNIPGAEIAQFFCLPAIRPTCTNQLIDTKIRTHLTFQIFLFTMKLLLKNNTFPTQTLPSCWSFNKYLEKLVFVQTEFLLNTPHFWPPPRWYPLPEASWSTSNRYLYPTRSRSSKKKKNLPASYFTLAWQDKFCVETLVTLPSFCHVLVQEVPTYSPSSQQETTWFSSRTCCGKWWVFLLYT